MRRADHERVMGVLERENNRLRAEVRELHDRIMYLTGKTWTPPPLDPAEEIEPPPEYEDPDLPGYTSRSELVGI